jgi:hypothetical protein
MGRGMHGAMLPVAPGIANGALGVIPQARAHRTPRAKEPRERPSGAWQVVAVDDGCGALSQRGAAAQCGPAHQHGQDRVKPVVAARSSFL